MCRTIDSHAISWWILSGPVCATSGIFLLLWSLLAYLPLSSLISLCLLVTYHKFSVLKNSKSTFAWDTTLTNIKYTNIVLLHKMQNGCRIPSEPDESFPICLKWKFLAAFCFFFCTGSNGISATALHSRPLFKPTDSWNFSIWCNTAGITI